MTMKLNNEKGGIAKIFAIIACLAITHYALNGAFLKNAGDWSEYGNKVHSEVVKIKDSF